MANNLHFALATHNAMLQAIVDAADGGSGAALIKIYTGTQPANGDASITGTLLVTLTCADPAFDSVATRVATLDTTPNLTATAAATGTAGYAVMEDSTGAVIFMGSIGTSGTDFIISSTSITSGQTVTMTSGTLTFAA